MADPRQLAAAGVDQAVRVGSDARVVVPTGFQDRVQSRKMVLIAVAVLLAINVYRADKESGSMYRRLWGTGVLGVMLSLLADFAPQIAGPFALVVSLAAFTNGGDQALQGVLGSVSSGAGAVKAGTSSTNHQAGRAP